MQKRFFDLHTDTASAIFDENKSLRRNDLHVDLERAEKVGEYAPFLTLFTDSRKHTMEGRYEILSENLLAEAEGKICFVTSGEAYEKAKAEGLFPAFRAVEGAEMLSCDPEKMRKAAREDALLMSGVCWNNPNPLYTAEGLTARGREYVLACAGEGVAVDVSHLNDRGTSEILSLGIRTVASHSNARALCGVPRNLPDELIRRIGENRGLIGLNFCRSFLDEAPEKQTLRRLAEHAAYISEIAGVGVLALGSDLDGAPLPDGVRGVEDLPLFARALSSVGFSDEEVDAISFRNAYTYFFREGKGK